MRIGVFRGRERVRNESCLYVSDHLVFELLVQMKMGFLSCEFVVVGDAGKSFLVIAAPLFWVACQSVNHVCRPNGKMSSG